MLVIGNETLSRVLMNVVSPAFTAHGFINLQRFVWSNNAGAS